MSVRFEAWERCRQLETVPYQHARLMDALIAAKCEPEVVRHEDKFEIFFRHGNREIELYLAKNSAWSRIVERRHWRDGKMKTEQSIENPSDAEVRKMLDRLDKSFEARFERFISAGFRLVRLGFWAAAYLFLLCAFFRLLQGNFEQSAIDAFIGIVIRLHLDYGNILNKRKDENL
jgi:hypothetical protein